MLKRILLTSTLFFVTVSGHAGPPNCFERFLDKAMVETIPNLRVKYAPKSPNNDWRRAIQEEDGQTVFSVMKKRYQLMAKVLAPLGGKVKTKLDGLSTAKLRMLNKQIQKNLPGNPIFVPAIYDIGTEIEKHYSNGHFSGGAIYGEMAQIFPYLYGITDEVPAALIKYAPEAEEYIKSQRHRFLEIGKYPEEVQKFLTSKYQHSLFNSLKTDKEFDLIGHFDPTTRLVIQENPFFENEMINYIIPVGVYGEEFASDLINAGITLGKITDDATKSLSRKIARKNPDMLDAEMMRVNYNDNKALGVRESVQEGLVSIVQAAAILTKKGIPGVDDPKEALRILLETRPNGTSLLTEFTSKHMMGIVGPFSLAGRDLGVAIIKGPDGNYVFSNEFKNNLSSINKKILESIRNKAKGNDEIKAHLGKDHPNEILKSPQKVPLAKHHLGRCPMTKNCDNTGRQPLQDIVEGYSKIFDSISSN